MGSLAPPDRRPVSRQKGRVSGKPAPDTGKTVHAADTAIPINAARSASARTAAPDRLSRKKNPAPAASTAKARALSRTAAPPARPSAFTDRPVTP